MTEKTEQPTPKRLRDARKKGQVASSRDVVTSALLISLLATIVAMSSRIADNMEEMILTVAQLYDMEYDFALLNIARDVFMHMIKILAPILGVVIIVGVASNVFQIGPLFALESVKPSFKKMNPISNIKNLVGKKKIFELIFNIIKLVALAIIIFLIIKSSLEDMLLAPSCGLDCMSSVLGLLVKRLILFSAFVFLIAAGVDFLIKKKLHIKELMMSKDEVKREFKEMEGDPLIKSKRKALAQQIAFSNVAQKIKKSSVIVTNPKHIAIALAYEKGKTPLPIVVAKGEEGMAKFIIETAKKESIPIMQNVPLARSLYEDAEVNQYIPSNMLEAVAAVFRWLQTIKR